MTLKLAIVRQRYNPFGGAERFVSRALPALERAGAAVTLIARRAEGWGARRLLRVDPWYVGGLWRDWSFARAARAAWRGARLGPGPARAGPPRPGGGAPRRPARGRAAAPRRDPPRPPFPPAGRLVIALNPRHRYLCRAEKRMFEHPRLR